MNLDRLPTPSLLLDCGILRRNIAAMHARMARHGVALRPHLKTAKSARVAQLATEGQPGGITVSTLAEAAYFLKHGFRDITYAVGILPGRLDQVAALQTQGADLKIITDNTDATRAIADRATRGDTVFRVLVEIDTGDHRAGVLPESEDLLEIARILHAARGVELTGVLTHAGQSYKTPGPEGCAAVAEAERAGVTRAAERLREAGLPCPVVSAGSTPTAVHARNLDGVTEMRPGVFMFNDLDQLAIGSCGRADLALSVLASIIGHNRHAGHVILDAGALALSKDVSAKDFRPEVGYGEVCEMTDLTPFPGLYVQRVSQEHGVVPVADPTDFERLPIGAKVRVLPNHACITAAAYDGYNVIENGAVVDAWDRVNGW